jgi:hypothetical protein
MSQNWWKCELAIDFSSVPSQAIPLIFRIQNVLGGSLDSLISATYTLLFDKPQDLFGSEFGLVDAVADPDPAIGAAGQEEAGILR